MSEIEQRVVQMQLDNRQFQQGIQSTLNQLQALNKGLQLQGATQGLNNVAQASRNVKLDHISNGVQSIADRFRAMSVVATTALATIAHRAVTAGGQMIKALTLEPLQSGFREYETNMNSIQTILVNTRAAGTNLKDVTSALDELNNYADDTIYNFAEMAKNIGTFTAAGVDLKTATASIKGIANLAAMSGTNSERAAGAMYQLSQAISAGKVSLEDWNSVVNAGMGGTVFQRALAETAVAMGKLESSALKLEGPMKNVSINGESFRNSISAVKGESWLTGDVLTATLQQFTGDLKDAELASMGFSRSQIANIQSQAKAARAAATEVKTLSGLFDTLKESAGTGWADTWRIIFGDFEEAKVTFTSVSNVLGGILDRSNAARNGLLEDWKELGGRTALIDAISNSFQALVSFAKPIGQAFREIFPPATGQQLYNLTIALRDFTAGLKIGGETADRLKRTFAGVFAVFGIAWDIVKGLLGVFFELFGEIGNGSGSILEITANIGDFLVGVREAINKGDALAKVFEFIGKILALPIKLVQFLAKVLVDLFDGFTAESAVESIGAFGEKLKPLGKAGEFIASVWKKVISLFDDLGGGFDSFGDKVAKFFDGFGTMVSNAMQNLDFGDLFAGIGVGSLATLLLTISNFISNLGGGGDSVLQGLRDSLEGMNDTLGAMQNTLRAATLLQIAAAIGILAVSLSILSEIDSDGLTRGATAIGALMAQLLTAMLVFERLSSFTGFLKMPFIAASMILLSVAVNILATAVKDLAELNWNELAKGLTGTTVLLAGLVLAARLMPDGASLISSATAMVVLAAAVKILASSVEDISELSWSEIAKGLIGVGALLGGLILFTKFAQANKGGLIQGAGIVLLAAGIKILASAMEDLGNLTWGEIAKGLVAMAGGLVLIGAALYLIPPTSVLSAVGILVVAASLKIIGDAMEKMGSLSWTEIAKGLVSMAGALTLITAALYLIPPSSILSAAAILVVAASLGMIAEALNQMGSMSWGEIAKSLVLLAGSLVIIGIAVTGMIAALPGAAALLVVAAALAILAPILDKFSEMSWGEIAKGLAMLAGTFLVLGAAGVILTPVVATLLALGVAITLLGVGILAAGAGVLLFSTALTALAAAGGAATLALVGMVTALLNLIPLAMQKIGEGIVAFANVIATAGPAMTRAITAVIMALIKAIDTLIPAIVETLYKMLTKMLQTMNKYVPKMVDSGLKLLNGILRGIANNIHKVVTTATTVVVRFINAVANNQSRVIRAGSNLIIKFINGVANEIRNRSDDLGRAGANLGTAIIEGMVRGLGAGVGTIASKAREVARSALNSAKSVLGINSPSKEFYKIGQWSGEGMANGLVAYSSIVSESASSMGTDAIESLRRSISGITDILNDDLDANPRITPVLDLSNIQQNAGKIESFFGERPISMSGSYSRARVVSETYRNSQLAQAERETSLRERDISFTQINNSPKALSQAEIYRQTKNQLSIAKEELV